MKQNITRNKRFRRFKISQEIKDSGYLKYQSTQKIQKWQHIISYKRFIYNKISVGRKDSLIIKYQ